VVVTEIEPKSPAASAKIDRGDVIVKVDGHPVASHDEFEQRVNDRGPGDRLRLAVLADGQEREVQLTAVAFPEADADDLMWDGLGFKVKETDDGLVVASVRAGSPVQRIGIQRGDRILGLGGAAVQSLPDLRRRLIAVRRARTVVLAVGRGPYQYNVQVPVQHGAEG
jgi:serine protease Do